MVFYERSILHPNKGLTEIKDDVLLEKLRRNFNNNNKHYGSMSPIICGTVVNAGQTYRIFERKLKMLRAPIYSLL